jgi:NAD(P)H-hydrate epimerase
MGGSLWVFEPSKKLLARVLKKAREPAPETTDGTWEQGDQRVVASTVALYAGELVAFAGGTAASLTARLARASAVAIGPGIGRSDAVRDLVASLWRHLDRPAVFDADALWALSLCGPLAEHAGPRLLTPHAGEMLRLLGRDPAGPEADDRSFLEAEARRMAADTGAVILLKGSGTLVTDGRCEARNTTGNPGMATAGTGDVLSGVAAALLAQGMSPFEAARLAAWVHGRAGDAATADLGEVSMTARDLLDRLHVAFREVVR